MLIRYKPWGKEPELIMANPEETDCWVDEDGLYLEYNGAPVRLIKSRNTKKLLKAMDEVYKAMKFDSFADMTALK